MDDPAVIRQLGTAHPLARHLGDFLTDLGNANSSAQTIRAKKTTIDNPTSTKYSQNIS